MGHKINPIGFRLRDRKNWNSIWFAKQNYEKLMFEDFALKNYLEKIYFDKGFLTSKIVVARSVKKVRIYIHLYDIKPFTKGRTLKRIIKDREQFDLNQVYSTLKKLTNSNIQLNIYFVSNVVHSAALIAKYIVYKLEKNNPNESFAFIAGDILRKIKQKYNPYIKGIDVSCAGCFQKGAMASTSWVGKKLKMPLHKINTNIDYTFLKANTKKGTFGIKVWICFNKNFQNN